MWFFGTLQRERKSRPGVKTPAETEGGALGNALQVLPSAPPPVSGQQQCKALLPSARLWQQSWFGTNQNTPPCPQQFPQYTILSASSPLERLCSHKKACAGPAFDLHMRTVGQREALLTGVKRGLAPLAGCGAAPRLPQTSRPCFWPAPADYFLFIRGKQNRGTAKQPEGAGTKCSAIPKHPTCLGRSGGQKGRGQRPLTKIDIRSSSD